MTDMIGPVEFVREVLIDPETDKPFELYPAEERFLREAFTLTADGRLPYSELMFGGPKKSGKTAIAAMMLIYVARWIGGRFAETYVIANDLEQSTGRVFTAASRIVKASPLLRREARVTGGIIEFTENGGTIQAIASDYKGAAGVNPSLVCADELWGFMSESAHRLWDEMVPSPTRKVSARFTTTYAGFEGESDLLEGLYKRGLHGEQIKHHADALMAAVNEIRKGYSLDAVLSAPKRYNANLTPIERLTAVWEDRFDALRLEMRSDRLASNPEKLKKELLSSAQQGDATRYRVAREIAQDDPAMAVWVQQADAAFKLPPEVEAVREQIAEADVMYKRIAAIADEWNGTNEPDAMVAHPLERDERISEDGGEAWARDVAQRMKERKEGQPQLQEAAAEIEQEIVEAEIAAAEHPKLRSVPTTPTPETPPPTAA